MTVDNHMRQPAQQQRRQSAQQRVPTSGAIAQLADRISNLHNMQKVLPAQHAATARQDYMALQLAVLPNRVDDHGTAAAGTMECDMQEEHAVPDMQPADSDMPGAKSGFDAQLESLQPEQ